MGFFFFLTTCASGKPLTHHRDYQLLENKTIPCSYKDWITWPFKRRRPTTAHASSSGTLSSIPTPTLYSPKILCAFQNVQCFFRLPCFGLCCAPAWGNFPLSVCLTKPLHVLQNQAWAHLLSCFLSVFPWALVGKLSKHPPCFLVLITVETSSDLMGRKQELGRHRRGMRVRFFAVYLFILIDIWTMWMYFLFTGN